MENNNATEIKKKAIGLFEQRREMILSDGAMAPDQFSLQHLSSQLDELAKQAGISVAALEFLIDPMHIERRDRVEKVFEDLNVGWENELKEAGLI